MTTNERSLPGSLEVAQYLPEDSPDFTGNPLSDTLTPRYEPVDIVRLVGKPMRIPDGYSALPARARMNLLKELEDWRRPLDWQIELAIEVDELIRDGYRRRNPIDKLYWDQVRKGKMILQQRKENDLKKNLDSPYRRELNRMAACCTLLGDSGTGKTQSALSSLRFQPEWYRHNTFYREEAFHFNQIVSLYVAIPPDGSLRDFFRRILIAVDSLLGTDYIGMYDPKQRATRDMLAEAVYSVVAAHGVGALIGDELQNLAEAKSNDASIFLNYLSDFINHLGLPMVLVGTPLIKELLSSELRIARRLTGPGGFEIRRWLIDQPEFRKLLEALWSYQVCLHPVDLTPELIEAMYYETQGILDLIIKVFVLAQIRAITSNGDVLSADVIHSVRDRLPLVQPMLEALRSGNPERIKDYDDLMDAYDIRHMPRAEQRNDESGLVMHRQMLPPPPHYAVKQLVWKSCWEVP